MAGSTGTGRPITMRCGWCRQHTGIEWSIGNDSRRGYRVTVTGRIAPLTSSQRGTGGSRVLQYRVEYRCDDCGRTGWSRHGSMIGKLEAASFEVSKQLRGHFPQVEKRRTLVKSQ